MSASGGNRDYRIPLRGIKGAGLFALVDYADYLVLNEMKWHLTIGGYAATKKMVNGKDTTVFMHRVINETPDGYFTDHINQNKLDNRKKNLRTVTRSQNQHNRSAYNTKKISKFKGVFFHKRAKKFTSAIRVDGKLKHLGYFENENDAACAYNNAAKIYHKKYACLNEARV